MDQQDEIPTSTTELHGSDNNDEAAEGALAAKNEVGKGEEDQLLDPEWIDHVKAGILGTFRPGIEREVSRTSELIRSQKILLETLEQEKTRLDEYTMINQASDLFGEIKIYHDKLVEMKKDMVMINDKVSKMMKKTQRLRILKQKEDMHKAQQEDKKLILEREITARPEYLEQ